MSSKLRGLLALTCVAVLSAAAVTAHASTITGSVYTTPPFPAPLSPMQSPPGTLLGTFTTSGINDFAAAPGLAYTVGGFISQGGPSTFSSAALAGMDLNNKELQFKGTVNLTAGTVYSITHDDGIFLYLNGSNTCTICAGDPTAPKVDMFTVGTTGAYTFDLLYAEVNGAPATLNFPASTNPVPEPGTLMLFGTGLIGLGGMIRRKIGM